VGDDIVTSLRANAEWIKDVEHDSWFGTAELAVEAADEVERLRAEVTAIRAERDCAQIQAAHLAQRLVAEARLHGGPP